MPLHRLTSVSYLGGLPATHDFLNDPAANGDSGLPANTDTSKKLTGPNAGTYFIAFGEDGTSNNGNRCHYALGENTDFLDDAVSGELPVPFNLDGTASGAVSSVSLTAVVFVGKSGVANNQAERDRLISVIDSVTGNELISSTGQKVTCTAILDSPGGSNVVGTQSSGFFTNPTVEFTPAIPNGTTYRIIYARRGSLVSIVPNKTDLDALTRLSIRAAHEVPAETLRFIRESSRRVGGSVAALCGTIFETPGVGDNILSASATMALDLDPSGAYSQTAHQWNLRGHRDTSQKDYLRFRYQLIGGPELLSPGFGLRIGDKWTETGKGGIPISDIQSNQYRYLDKNNTGVLNNPSILAMMNSRWTVTVGDGINTVADFYSIDDAVDFFKSNNISTANYGHGVHILLKAGEYDISDIDIDALVSGTNHTGVTIQGCSKEGCVITVGGTTAGFIVENLGSLTLQNLTLVAGTQKTAVKLGSRGKLCVQDCIFRQVKFDIIKSLDQNDLLYGRSSYPAFVADRCVFEGAGMTDAVIDFALDLTVDTKGYIFTDCYFSSEQDYPIVQIADTATTTDAYLRGVFFERCELYPGGSTTTVSSDPMGGVLYFNPVAYRKLRVTDITYRDCNVHGVELTGGGGTPTSSTLLYLRARTSGSTQIYVDTFRILGGSWKAYNGKAGSILPFYIGTQTGARGTSSGHPENVILKDVALGWVSGTANNNGSPPTILSSFGSQAEAAAYVITAAKRLVMCNIEYFNPTCRSGSGDFLLGSVGLDIDGIHIGDSDWSDDTSFGTPNYRIRLDGYGDVRRLDVYGYTSASTTASVGVVSLDSYGLRLFECYVRSFGNSEIAYQAEWNGGSNLSLELSQCRGNSCYRGFRLYHDGIVSSDHFYNLRIRGCDFNNNAYAGISITGGKSVNAYGVRNLELSNNHVCENTTHGIVFAPGLFSEDDCQEICNNIVHDNGTPTATQIRIGNSTSEAFGEDCYAMIQGNNCGSSGGNLGDITITRDSGGPHTPYTDSTWTDLVDSAGPVTTYWHVDGHRMILNRANLSMPAI